MQRLDTAKSQLMSRNGPIKGKHTEIRLSVFQPPTGIMKKSKSNVKDAGQSVETHEGVHQEQDALGGSRLSGGSGRQTSLVNILDSLTVSVQGENHRATGPEDEHRK